MKRWRWLALSTCLLALTLSLSWGMYGDDSVYITFIEARQGTAVTIPASFWVSPAYFVLLWAGSQLGLQPEWVSLIINGLCWGGLAVLAARLLVVSKETAVATALLITLSPALFLMAGTHAPFTLFAAFLALFFSKQQTWSAQTLVLIILPLLHFDLSTPVFLLALLWLRWRTTSLFPTRTTILLLTLYGTWAGLMSANLGITELFTFPSHLADLLATMGELAWLLLPLAGLGLFSWRDQLFLRVLVGWTAVSFIVSGPIGLSLTLVTIWLLAGCGLHHLLNHLPNNKKQAPSPTLLALTLPLFILSLWSLGHWYAARPIVRFDLEKQASQWLQNNSQPQATLMASAHLLNHSQHSGTAWTTETSSQLPALSSTIQTITPDYLVTMHTVPFDQLQRASWFQENYVTLQQFTSPYESTAPLTVWGYRPTVYDLGAGRPLNVHTDHNINIVGYQYEPTHLQPGQDLHLTLFLQATQPITIPLNAWLRLTPFNNSQESVRQITPITADWPTNSIYSQTITATIPADSSIGAYQLSFSLQEQGQEDVLALYRNNDVNMLDRVGLGNVIVLGEAATGEALPINASFGEQITLLAYTLSIQPDALILDLFWQATQPPSADYVIFIHVLAADEQLVANQDAPPLDGRFPTSAWLPNDIIPDRHTIPLPPNTTGSYQLNIGLYHSQTGQRLTILNSEGIAVPNNTLTLQSVERQ